TLYYTAELARSGVSGRGLSVLEIGLGNGQFAAWCLARDHSYAGTEIDSELVDRAREAGLDAHVAPDSLTAIWPDETFDLVCAFDVLEHLTHDQIITMLGEIRSLLRPGGRVVARFPSGDSPFSLGMYNGDITHRSHLGWGAVRQICLEVGLEPVQIRHPVLPIKGLGLKRAIRRAMVAAMRWAIRGFVRQVYFGGTPRVVDPNMLIVLRKP
ncbi:MAG: class I SAM-dependent methyltransferase, partial [Paracoccaceae bacterium]